jgi:hypothetical protein
MEAPAMAAAGGPYWGEDGYRTQGIDNCPRKLRGMLRRLKLRGWDESAGEEPLAGSDS